MVFYFGKINIQKSKFNHLVYRSGINNKQEHPVRDNKTALETSRTNNQKPKKVKICKNPSLSPL